MVKKLDEAKEERMKTGRLLKKEEKQGTGGAPALATNSSLALFWTNVVEGNVVENVKCPGIVYGDGKDQEKLTETVSTTESDQQPGTDITTLAFKGHTDTDIESATWGPSFSFSVLVERAEYVRCWDIIQSKPWKFILLRGTKGVGKSVFIYWFIYKLIKEARTAKGALTTFLLISAGGERKVFNLLSVSTAGVPLVQRVSPGVAADYTLSDIEYDPAVTGPWNMNVVGYGAKEEPKRFTDKVDDAGELGLKFLMEPCTLEELQAMHEPGSTLPTFAYTLFGGSARMARLQCSTSGSRSDVLYSVEGELTEFLADSSFATETFSFCHGHHHYSNFSLGQ